MSERGVGEKLGGTKLERARIIRDHVLAIGGQHGRWELLDVGKGVRSHAWLIRPGAGWWAMVTTPTSRRSEQVPSPAEGLDQSAQVAVGPSGDLLLDLYVDGASKVLSLSTVDGVDTLIGMKPGPWEAGFELEDRSWSAGVARRLEGRAA